MISSDRPRFSASARNHPLHGALPREAIIRGLQTNSCGRPYRRTISVGTSAQRLGGMLNYYRRSCVNCVDSVSGQYDHRMGGGDSLFYSVPLRVRLRTQSSLGDQQARSTPPLTDILGDR